MIYELKNVNKNNRKQIIYSIDNNGCWVCISYHIGKDGYPKRWYQGKKQAMHRVIFIDYFNITNLPRKIEIRHTCDNKACINPKHLLQGLHIHNMYDMVERNRQAKGVNIGSSKLVEKEVLEIRNNVNDSFAKLAVFHGVSETAISKIKNRSSWGWLK